MPDSPDPQQTPGQVLAGSPPPQQTPPQQQQAPPPPDASNMPLNARQGPGMAPSGFPQQPPQPTPQQLKQAAVDQHHKELGKVTSFLFGQQIDADTGQKKPETPGSVLRSLLAGALLGASAGLKAGKEGQGILGGIAAGGVAGMGWRDQQDQQNQAQADKKQKMSEEQQTAADEHLVHQATAAHLTAETVAFHHLQEAHDQEALDAKNKAARIYMQTLEAAGAHTAQIPVNGRVPSNGEYNASELSKAITKDPKVLFAPPGSVRHFVDIHNADDVEFVEGKGWVNASGEPANMTAKTVVKVLDVPESIYKTPIHKTGAEINTLVGYQLIPKDQEDHVFTMPLDAATNLYTTNLKNLNQKAQADQREGAAAASKAKANNAGGTKPATPGQFDKVAAARAASVAKAEAAYRDPANLRLYHNDQELARVKAEAQATYDDRVRTLKGGKGGQGLINVTDPKGVVHSFTDKKSADAFKKAVGIQ
jgi:hypothetical protein